MLPFRVPRFWLFVLFVTRRSQLLHLHNRLNLVLRTALELLRYAVCGGGLTKHLREDGCHEA